MKSKSTQLFTDEYLKNCKKLGPEQILTFLEDFKQLQSVKKEKSILISIKVPESLLSAFRQRAKLENSPYQSLIKQLMRSYLES